MKPFVIASANFFAGSLDFLLFMYVAMLSMTISYTKLLNCRLLEHLSNPATAPNEQSLPLIRAASN